MKVRLLTSAVLTLSFTSPFTSAAQEKGTWHASSKTAMSVTGDVVFSNEKISINFANFPVAQIRNLKPEEAAAVFGDGAAGRGNLYRVSIPASKLFLHKNTLCGSDETQWMVTSVEGKHLQLAFFSNAQMPVLTVDGLANSPNLCGTYSYSR